MLIQLIYFYWQFCVHSDKKKMLEELTNDIHQSPNKQKVLMELANCIASGEDILLDFCNCVHNPLVFFNTSLSLTNHRR